MNVKTIAPHKRFRYKHMTWVSGRRNCSPEEIELIKEIDPALPITDGAGVVLNPIVEPKVAESKDVPKKVANKSKPKKAKPNKEIENEDEDESRPTDTTEVQGEEL